MARFDLRALVLVPVLLAAAACGDDEAPQTPPPPSPVATASSPAADSGPAPGPSESVYEEEDVEPTAEAGDLPQEAQSYLDEALDTELGALETAAPATAAAKRKTLEKLPATPTEVLSALKDYEWVSPEAKALYGRAVAAS